MSRITVADLDLTDAIDAAYGSMIATWAEEHRHPHPVTVQAIKQGLLRDMLPALPLIIQQVGAKAYRQGWVDAFVKCGGRRTALNADLLPTPYDGDTVTAIIELVDFDFPCCSIDYMALVNSVADYIDPETVTDPEPAVVRTVTACNARPACKRGCAQFVPGPIIGRDQDVSCLTCTHTRAIHQPAKTPTKKAARR